MLNEIYVRDYALVDELRIEFDSGFTVLTGETGAGKSIIVGAISTVLGERASADSVRTNAEKCRIEAVFDIYDSENTKKSAVSAGIDIEDNILIVSREINKNGKSTCRVNGQTITATLLRELTRSLIDIHGQHDHQSLLAPAMHIDIYDSWLGKDALTLRDRIRQLHHELSRAVHKKEALNKDARERERKIDLLTFQHNEIESAELRVGELDELAAASSKLLNAEKLLEGIQICYQLLSDDSAVLDKLQELSVTLEKLAEIDLELGVTAEQSNQLTIIAQDISASIREYRDNIDLDTSAMETVENRLNLINNLRRKYGETIEDILDFKEQVSTELVGIQNAAEFSSDLDTLIEKLKRELLELSQNMSRIRESGRECFERDIELHLADLAMEDTQFCVEITECPAGEKGINAVEFLISPNPGEPLKPLSKIASGGEISRVMLSIKTVCAGSETPTLIFDEIDAGIGGQTGIALGKKIAALSKSAQILCVTHLPQVASVANQHLNVAKTIKNGHTTINITELDKEERAMELARMLGAGDSSDTAMEHAREMLASADKRNRKIR